MSSKAFQKVTTTKLMARNMPFINIYIITHSPTKWWRRKVLFFMVNLTTHFSIKGLFRIDWINEPDL